MHGTRTAQQLDFCPPAGCSPMADSLQRCLCGAWQQQEKPSAEARSMFTTRLSAARSTAAKLLPPHGASRSRHALAAWPTVAAICTNHSSMRPSRVLFKLQRCSCGAWHATRQNWCKTVAKQTSTSKKNLAGLCPAPRWGSRPRPWLGLCPRSPPGYRPGPRRGSPHAAAHIGKFLGNFRTLRAQANFESNFEKSLPGPIYSLIQQRFGALRNCI